MAEIGPEIGNHRWIHPGVVLVATNLGDLDRLMPFARKIAGKSGTRLILLHVLPASASITVDAAGMPYYDQAGAMEIAGRALETWCKLARSRGINCEALVREGQAAREIVSAARQFGADLLLLGTRSRGRLGQLLLGSVARQVLRSVNLPVMTVGPEAHLPAEVSDPKETVLHATTFGETSRPSAALACQIAAGRHAKLLLLHVAPPFDELTRKGLSRDWDVAMLHELHALAFNCGANGCASVEEKLAHGDPAIEILAEAAMSHASLIVLGAAHHSVFENLTRDRTVYKVLAHARCPVLTLRRPAHKPVEVESADLAIHG